MQVKPGFKPFKSNLNTTKKRRLRVMYIHNFMHPTARTGYTLQPEDYPPHKSSIGIVNSWISILKNELTQGINRHLHILETPSGETGGPEPRETQDRGRGAFGSLYPEAAHPPDLRQSICQGPFVSIQQAVLHAFE